MPGVAFVLQGAQLDTLARLTLPLSTTDVNPSSQAHATLRRIQALHCPSTTPLTAWISGTHSITVYTQKKAAAKVYKLLYSNQAQLGIVVGPVKSHISLGIQSRAELADALRLTFTTGLQAHGWFQLTESRLLSSNPYTITTTTMTTMTTCASITVAVEALSTSSIIVLIKPEIVTFRHPCSSTIFSPTSTSTTSADIGDLIGTRCTLLPNLLPALIAGIDMETSPSQQEDIINQWDVLSLGLFKYPTSTSESGGPSSAMIMMVKVQLTNDPDAPTVTVPAPCILGSSGLDVTQEFSLKSPGIVQLLARLQRELPLAAAGIVSVPSSISTGGGGTTATGDGQQNQQPAAAEMTMMLVVEKMCVWNYEKEEGGGRVKTMKVVPEFKTGIAFQSADTLLNKPSPFNTSIWSLLGPPIDLHAATSSGGTYGDGTAAPDVVAVKKFRVTAGPQLKGFIAKMKEQEQQEEEEQNKLLRANAVATTTGKKVAVTFKGLPPSLTTAATGPRSSIKTPAFVSKRGAFSLTPGTATTTKSLLTGSRNKKPKFASSSAAASTVDTATTTKPPPATAKPKKPAAIEVDVSSFNIPQLVQSNTLSTLTIPQLKAYLKSVKKPVGGKKSDLEERVKQYINAL